MWLARDLASPSMIDLMADPDRLFERSDCVIIKDQRKIKVGRAPLEWGGKKIVVYIKRYNAFSLATVFSLFLLAPAQRNHFAARPLYQPSASRRRVPLPPSNSEPPECCSKAFT